VKAIAAHPFSAVDDLILRLIVQSITSIPDSNRQDADRVSRFNEMELFDIAVRHTDFPYNISGYQSRLIFLHILILSYQPVMFVAHYVMVGGSKCIYLVVLSPPVPSSPAMAQVNSAL
jgi:hypothetical protein